MNWILFGFRGCGKTTLARLAARKFALPYFDTDEWIEEQTGLSPKEIVQERGVEAFQELEARAVREAATLRGHLIATGGATLLTGGNYQILRPVGHFIYLKASREVLEARWEANPHSHLSDFDSVYKERLPLYAKMAESIIIPENDQPVEKLWEVIHSAAYSKSQPGVNPTAKPLA